MRDGGSFTTRRVAARQHGAIIFYMTASFQKLEDGFDHQDPMPEVLAPLECPSVVDLLSEQSPEAGEFWLQEWAAADVRRAPCDDPTRQRMWFRLNGEIADERTMRTALLTYYSDLTLLGPTLRPHGLRVSAPEVQVASLDHTIWFHRSTHADQWFLYDQHSPSASHGRGLALASVFAESGELVASIAQEGLIRPSGLERDDLADEVRSRLSGRRTPNVVTASWARLPKITVLGSRTGFRNRHSPRTPWEDGSARPPAPATSSTCHGRCGSETRTPWP